MYKVLTHPKVGKKIKKLKRNIKKISKIYDEFEKDPEKIGKPLKFTRGLLREVYIGSYRLYFSFSKDTKTVEVLGIVYVLGFAHKDEQKGIINKIVNTFERLKRECDRFRFLILFLLKTYLL